MVDASGFRTTFGNQPFGAQSPCPSIVAEKSNTVVLAASLCCCWSYLMLQDLQTCQFFPSRADRDSKPIFPSHALCIHKIFCVDCPYVLNPKPLDQTLNSTRVLHLGLTIYPVYYALYVSFPGPKESPEDMLQGHINANASNRTRSSHLNAGEDVPIEASAHCFRVSILELGCRV